VAGLHSSAPRRSTCRLRVRVPGGARRDAAGDRRSTLATRAMSHSAGSDIERDVLGTS
jgi:hypothetical protein